MGETAGLFGAISPAQAATPEPHTIMLLLTGGLAFQGIRYWRRRKVSG